MPYWLLEAERLWCLRRWLKWSRGFLGRRGRRHGAWCFWCRRRRAGAVKTREVLEEAMDYVHVHGVSKEPEPLVFGEAGVVCMGRREA